jgi:hypothetical protein
MSNKFLFLVLQGDVEWRASLLKSIGKGKGFGYNHKIMIIRFRSRHLVLWLLENLWFMRVRVKDWLYKGKTYHPPVHPT